MHAAPQAALRRIHFVQAQRPDAHNVSADDLRLLIPLNDPLPEPSAPDGAMTRSGSKGAGRPAAAGLRKELFKEEDLTLQWREMRKAGAGLANLGNTCFMNSVLQSLVHTPPLAELLLGAGTGRIHNGAVNGFYPIQLARELVTRSLAHHSRTPLQPLQFAKSLRRISRSFRLGRQEDAHEFLIALLDAMHEASIAGMQPKPAPELAQTSFIYRIFGGRMRSQIKCCECGYESNTYDPCIDLSLEITRAPTVRKALERFTSIEWLDGANKYKCSKQQKLVRAAKRMTVDAAPNVLMIQLKRFEFSFSGHKISKKIDFDLELDLAPYMSERPRQAVLYDLYAVLVHSGHSVHSGHYYSYVRAPNGIWHICDDTNVAQVSERQVMAQKAYILFYLKRQPGGRRLPPTSARGAAAAPSPAAAAAPSAARAAAPSPAAAARPQDVQQPPAAALGPHQRAEIAALAAGAAAAKAPAAKAPAAKAKAPATAAAAAAAAPAASGKKRKQQEASAATAAPRAAAAAAAAAEEAAQLSPLKSRSRPQQNGRISKRPRLRSEEEGGKAGMMSPLRPLRRLVNHIVQSPLANIVLGRRGGRLAEAVSITAASKLRRRGGGAAAASPAAASPPAAAPAPAAASPARPAAQPSSPATSGGGGSATTSVVSAPAWPPLKQQRQQQQPAGEAGQQPVVKQFKRRKQREKEREQAEQQQQQQQQQQHRQQQASPAANGQAEAGGDVKSYLRSSGGGTSLRLTAWDDADASAKRQQAALLRQEAPKRRRLDEYDLEYDRGRTKKVRAKRQSEDGEDGGMGAAALDAAWQAKQRDGVRTELRGNRKRRSQDFKQQQQQQQRRRHSGGRGWRPSQGGGGRPGGAKGRGRR